MSAYARQTIFNIPLAATGKESPAPFDPSRKYNIGDRFSKNGINHQVIDVDHNGIYTMNEIFLEQMKWS